MRTTKNKLKKKKTLQKISRRDEKRRREGKGSNSEDHHECAVQMLTHGLSLNERYTMYTYMCVQEERELIHPRSSLFKRGGIGEINKGEEEWCASGTSGWNDKEGIEGL